MIISVKPGLLSIKAFCIWADIGRTKAYAEIASGRLRTVKVGRRRLVPAEAVSDWLQAHTTTQVSLHVPTLTRGADL